MKKAFTYIALILGLVVLFSSCDNPEGSNYSSRPVAMGKRNKITVIADKPLWDGSIRDSFNYYFAAAYPIMPRPEPIFDIRHFTVSDLGAEPLRKKLRTYIILSDLSDKDSPATKMLIKDLGEQKYQEALLDKTGKLTVSAGVDKWANKQLLVYLYGIGKEGLASSIRTNFSKVAKRINKHDLKQLEANTYGLKVQRLYTNDVLRRYGINMNIPGDYKEAKYDSINNVTWYRKDTKTAILNLSIQKEKYTNEKQFTKDYIIQMRDKFGKKYVSTNEKDSYMKSNVVSLPVFEYSHKYGNMDTKEIRGIWEIVNDFVGGPYISFALYNQAKGEIIYIDCFIMNKGKDKRNMMQEMEYIVSSMRGVEH